MENENELERKAQEFIRKVESGEKKKALACLRDKELTDYVREHYPLMLRAARFQT